MAETDLADWLTVDDTAGRIGCSKRTVERLGQAKQLESRLRRQEGTPPVAVYNPDDVARIAQERRPAAVPFVLPAASGNGNGKGTGHALSIAPEQGKLVAAEDLIRQFFTLAVQALHSPPSPPKDVTVAEMAETKYVSCKMLVQP